MQDNSPFLVIIEVFSSLCQNSQLLTILCAGTFLCWILVFEKCGRSKSTLKYIPLPVSHFSIQPEFQGNKCLLQQGSSWLWGHEHEVLSRPAGFMYTKWLEELGTSVIRIRGALYKPDIVSQAFAFVVVFRPEKCSSLPSSACNR